MIVLHKSEEKDIIQFGARLYREHAHKLSSFEEAAHVVVKAIYGEFQLEDSSPLFSLLRVFRFGSYQDMHPSLLPLANADVKYWLTLMASWGVEADWCDRRTSKNHRIIPADSPVTPMLRAAFAQIGLQFGDSPAKSDLEIQQDREMSVLKYFYVPNAAGSPYIPDQEHFVLPYKVESVVGFGFAFAGRSSYFCIGFSRRSMSAEEARRFARMNASIGMLLAENNQRQIWNN